MTKTFTPPPIARQYCRHYHYDRGPRCNVGVVLTEPGACFVCMPDKGDTREPCPKREEWTSAERATWREYQSESTERLINAIAALPRPMRTGGTVACPNCDGGTIRYDRWHRGASLNCSTPHCCGARFITKEPTDWPAGKDETP